MNEKAISQSRLKGLANYETVSERYFRRRQLQGGSAGWFLLWGLAVGAVIMGDFFGWNLGLTAGGFWGLTIATVLMTVMYICMIYSISELSAAFPYAGGFYGFTRSAFGSFWGYMCGLTVAVEYILTTATIAVTITDYLKPLIPNVPVYLLWLAAYVVFGALNIRGAKLSLNITLALALIGIMVLALFYVCILTTGIFSWDLLFNIPAAPGQSATWLPKGWQGVLAAIPYGIWFYLAIEQLPMAAEETRDVPKNLPRGLTIGLFTLIGLAFLTLVLNTGVGGGAAAISSSPSPLAAGLEAYFGQGATSTLITTLALLAGVVVSFHGEIFGFGRILFSLSRAGYLPRWISVTNQYRVPARAIMLGSVIGLACALLVDLTGSGILRAALLNMAVFGAVLSYLLVMLSYIKLKLEHPALPRPYQSPLGLWGGVVGAGLSILAFCACFAIPDYRPGLWGILIFLLLAAAYFLFHSKNHLVAQAPEEAAALKQIQ
jgi:ethanolamine permease